MWFCFDLITAKGEEQKAKIVIQQCQHDDSALVPKLQLGNPYSEAPASRDRKLELPAPNSQAGAWELATSCAFNLF
jgi:hypothetical protein